MSPDLNSLSAYQFDLPPELIAQVPITPRDSSRLMVIDRSTGNISEMVFRDLKDFLKSRDSLVFNDTKVIPARIIGKRPTGGTAEIFLVRSLGNHIWEALARPGKKMRAGSKVEFGNNFSCEILETLPNGNKIVRFDTGGEDFERQLDKFGQMPLPMYIKREGKNEEDAERYQTIYAANPGALAAPTAGLHFTEEMIKYMKNKGIDQSHITLHVGLGTFRPVQVDDIRQHPMHSEQFLISPDTATRLNQRSITHRQICVGTTSCRALETASNVNGEIISGTYDTNIFIHPGYQFKYVKSLLTNFHIPGSTLLMLVCAFAGYDLTMEAYARAIKDRYRFYSYGDAMLIL